MELFFTILICILAGLGAGFGTGLAGLSAASVIAPMLITFLHVDAFEAIGIALASDVLASAVSAFTYGKNKHLDIKNGLVMLISVLIATVIGSILASYLPSATIGGFSMFMTLIAGLKFIFFPVLSAKEKNINRSKKIAILQSILCGIAIGLVCGFVGAGGGMLMLLILVTILGYELKTAVGTSVFIMTFTALIGSASHFIISNGVSNWVILLVCVLTTFIGAQLTAKFANKASPKVLNRVLGGGLVILSIVMIIVYFMQ